MCKRDTKLKKKYIILMNYDYSNVFSEIEGLSIENVRLLIPDKGCVLTEETIVYLKNRFGENYRCIKNSEKEILDVIENFKPDVLLTMGWRKIISNSVFEEVNLSINIHPALLPEYKGYHPLPYLLMNGENEHGITAHLISKEVDAGDIVLQRRFEINKFSTINSLIDMTEKIMPTFFQDLINQIESNDIETEIQDERKTKIIAKRRKPSDSEIDPSKSLNELFDNIRACDKDRFPPFFYVEGEKVYVKIWRDTQDKANQYDI